ncbi:MAG: ChbG/HpnK family deacetylase [Oscillospiraceae bacterium]|nr:ChbG/HpnK family deacetylase [Oscillospiraceae bacterium]
MIRYCADDVGLNPMQIQRVADCAENSALNVASIFGNSPYMAESVEALWSRCALALHFNLSEGRAVSDPAGIPLLAGADGSFHPSFLRLLLLSLARPKALEEQIRIECAAQLGRLLDLLPEDYCILIDSHRHVHMIPAVFRGVCQTLEASGRRVEQLRWPVEALGVYIRTPRVWRYFRPQNLLKAVMLKLCSLPNEKALRRRGIRPDLFCGIVFAGCMSVNALRPVLGKLEVLAGRENRGLELLFHPGGTERGELYFDRPHSHFERFYRSPLRKAEAEALRTLHAKQQASADSLERLKNEG